MTRKIKGVLFAVFAIAALVAGAAWWASAYIESPAEIAAGTDPPEPSPILVPVEERELSSKIITRGTARFGLPQPISIAPSTLKPDAGLVATLPRRNTQLQEGDVLLSASGRPVFLLQGRLPAYRDLMPGTRGEDVRQFEAALVRLGFAPGTVDDVYDQATGKAVARWYRAQAWEPFESTREQLAVLHALELEWGQALKAKTAADTAVAAADLAVKAAQAVARHNNKAAAAELAARRADLNASIPEKGGKLAVQSEQAKAEFSMKAAEAEIAAKIAERALIVLDPRQPESARRTADANLEMARAALEKIRLESEMAITAAQRAAQRTDEQYSLAQAAVASAQAAVESVRLEGERAVQAAIDERKLAKLDAGLATERADRLAAELKSARARLGTYVPADEIVFIPVHLPVRVEELMVAVGDPARGVVMSVTDNQLVIDTALALDAAPLVEQGMVVFIDEQALGIKVSGIVSQVAATPGTRGVDGYHIYCEIRVESTDVKLEGMSLRLTIPIESTGGAVVAVPVNALSLSVDGSSRVQVARGDELRYITVEPGLSAEGYVEVTPVEDTLAVDDLVVIGYEHPAADWDAMP